MFVKLIKSLLFVLGTLLSSTTLATPDFRPVPGGEFAKETFQGVDYAIFHAEAKNVRLLWQNKDRVNYRSLRSAGNALSERDETVAMMMNAGIFTAGEQPAGLWIEQGKTLHKLNTNKGKGNFHIQPNGVFTISGNRADIFTTVAWQKFRPKADYALQSGPMLVIDGKINSRFVKNLSSPYKRNAVCLTRNRDLYFIITTNYQKEWPSFYRLSEALVSFGCYQALYLDGNISHFYMPGESGWFHWKNFAGMIAVVTSN